LYRLLLHFAFHLFFVLVFSAGHGKTSVNFSVWSHCYFFHALINEHSGDFIGYGTGSPILIASVTWVKSGSGGGLPIATTYQRF